MGANRLLIPANRANFALRSMKPCAARKATSHPPSFPRLQPKGRAGCTPRLVELCLSSCGPKLMANPKHLKAIRRGAKGRGSPTRTSEKRSSSRRISAKRPNDAANVYDSNLCTKNISGANLRGTTLVEARCTWQDRSARSRHSVLPAPLTQAGSRPDQTADNVSPNYAIAGRQRHLHLRSTLRRNARRRRLSHALATHPRMPQSIPIISQRDRMSAISVP
jgi:hypothetical protein